IFSLLCLNFVVMFRYFKISILLLGTLLYSVTSWSQEVEVIEDDLIQITGVTMTADSLMAVPDVIISVKHKNRGNRSSELGVFSIVCNKGDTLLFNAMGYNPVSYTVPQDIVGKFFTMVQLMVQDTFHLPETIMRAYLPTAEEFDYAFKYWSVPDDQYEIARQNLSPAIISLLLATMPRNGRESQREALMEQANKAVYYGQTPQQGIFSPFKWAEFINAWKRGDFRKKY